LSCGGLVENAAKEAAEAVHVGLEHDPGCGAAHGVWLVGAELVVDVDWWAPCAVTGRDRPHAPMPGHVCVCMTFHASVAIIAVRACSNVRVCACAGSCGPNARVYACAPNARVCSSAFVCTCMYMTFANRVCLRWSDYCTSV
jgi:hypothetical protein